MIIEVQKINGSFQENKKWYFLFNKKITVFIIKWVSNLMLKLISTWKLISKVSDGYTDTTFNYNKKLLTNDLFYAKAVDGSWNCSHNITETGHSEIIEFYNLKKKEENL